MNKLNEWGPMTVLMVVAAALLLIGGIANVILDDTYSYANFLDDLKTAVIGFGALGIGRGLLGGLTNAGLAVNLPGTDPTGSPDESHEASARPDFPGAQVQEGEKFPGAGA